MKLQFSGHESFECRRLWLKKGYDHITTGGKFNEEAVINLGVGRNMVNSIRYWMRAYGLTNESEQLTTFANQIFADDGFDPYIEDEATLWLLHFNLVSLAHASIYNIVFNELRRQKPEFTKEHLLSFINSKYKVDINEATFGKDFEAFSKTYMAKDEGSEDSYEGLLTELNIIKDVRAGKSRKYIIEADERKEIPPAVILHCLLRTHAGNSINLENALLDVNSVGSIFVMTKQGLANKMEEVARDFGLVFSNNTGVQELQFKSGRPSHDEILTYYYRTYAN